MADTMGTLERMYRHFGIALSKAGRAGMVQYLADNPRVARPPHKVDMPVEAISYARRAYKPYQDYFDVPGEV